MKWRLGLLVAMSVMVIAVSAMAQEGIPMTVTPKGYSWTNSSQERCNRSQWCTHLGSVTELFESSQGQKFLGSCNDYPSQDCFIIKGDAQLQAYYDSQHNTLTVVYGNYAVEFSLLNWPGDCANSGVPNCVNPDNPSQ